MGTNRSSFQKEWPLVASGMRKACDFKLNNDELASVFQAFIALDVNNTNTISLDEILKKLPVLNDNPLIGRIFECFDDNDDGRIDFGEFVKNLQIFCDLNPTEEKFKFIFEIYDTNSDGYISNGDLFRVLKVMVGENLIEAQIQELVDRTMLCADKDKDGKLSYAEFKDFIDSLRLSHSFKILHVQIPKPLPLPASPRVSDQSKKQTTFPSLSDQYSDGSIANMGTVSVKSKKGGMERTNSETQIDFKNKVVRQVEIVN
eukprot:UN31934